MQNRCRFSAGRDAAGWPNLPYRIHAELEDLADCHVGTPSWDVKMPVESQSSDAVRIDRWLCAARLYKSRSATQAACAGGHVKLNGVSVRASHLVEVGDRIECVAPSGRRAVQVLALADKRQSPPRARELYEDHSPPPPPRDERAVVRPRGAGRPTKAERRSLERLRGVH